MRYLLPIGLILLLPSVVMGVVVGGLVSGATGLDSEYTSWTASTTPGAWKDCTNEATEIGSSGVYYLELTSTELDAPYVAIQIKSNEANTVLLLVNNTSAWLGDGDIATTVCLVNSSNSPIASAIVTIKNTAQTVTYARKTSDANGKCSFALVAGTYYVIISDYGQHTWTVPETLTVAGDTTSDTYTGTTFSPDDPSTPNVCVLYGWLKNPDGSGKSGQTVTATLRPDDYPAAYDSDSDGTVDRGINYAKTGGSDTTDSNGYWSIELTYSALVLRIADSSTTATKYRITISEAGVEHDVTIPSAASARLDSLTLNRY